MRPTCSLACSPLEARSCPAGWLTPAPWIPTTNVVPVPFVVHDPPVPAMSAGPARHANGQAKYLEQPARTLVGFFQATIRKLRGSGYSLSQCFAVVGEVLLRVSQSLVPVQTGTLRDSGFYAVER